MSNNRHTSFYSDVDFAAYLDKLKKYSERKGVDTHAFVPIINHVHLWVTSKNGTGASRMVQ